MGWLGGGNDYPPILPPKKNPLKNRVSKGKMGFFHDFTRFYRCFIYIIYIGLVGFHSFYENQGVMKWKVQGVMKILFRTEPITSALQRIITSAVQRIITEELPVMTELPRSSSWYKDQVRLSLELHSWTALLNRAEPSRTSEPQNRAEPQNFRTEPNLIASEFHYKNRFL